MNWNPARPRPRLRGSLLALALALLGCAHAGPKRPDAQAVVGAGAPTTPAPATAANDGVDDLDDLCPDAPGTDMPRWTYLKRHTTRPHRSLISVAASPATPVRIRRAAPCPKFFLGAPPIEVLHM